MNNDNYLVVGMGNPGDTYFNTPHNIGSDLVKNYYEQILSIPNVTILLQPTFVNITGDFIKDFIGVNKNQTYTLIVVVDDIDIKFNDVQIKFNTLARGHNGIRNIITNFGAGFYRILVGVGKSNNISEYVLTKMDDEKIKDLLQINIYQRILDVIQKNNQLNQKNNLTFI